MFGAKRSSRPGPRNSRQHFVSPGVKALVEEELVLHAIEIRARSDMLEQLLYAHFGDGPVRNMKVTRIYKLAQHQPENVIREGPEGLADHTILEAMERIEEGPDYGTESEDENVDESDEDDEEEEGEEDGEDVQDSGLEVGQEKSTLKVREEHMPAERGVEESKELGRSKS